MLPHTLLVLAALCMNNPRPEIVAKNAKNVRQLETEVGDISGY